MFNRLRKRAKEAIEKLKKEKLEKKVIELEEKKEPGKKVDTEREKADKALERFDAMEVFVDHSTMEQCFFKELKTILHYLMNKEDK